MTSKNLRELLADKDSLMKELRSRGKELVTQEIEQFFKENPKVTGVYWDQYAPNFNDGDPCIFHVHEFFVTHAENPVEMESRWDGWEDSGVTEQSNDASKIRHLIGDEDLLQMAFGDDCCVKCLRTGTGVSVETDYVDHD